MKIAIFTESFHPVVNGVTRSIDTLVADLNESGHETIVYAPRARGYVDSDSGVRRFPSYYVKRAPEYPLAIPFSPRLFREFAREGFDVVHTQTPFALGLSGLFLARRNRIPLVAHLHTLYVEYCHYVPFVPLGLMRWITRKFLVWFYCQAQVVIVPSPSVEGLLRSYGMGRPVAVVPTGVRLTGPGDRLAARRHLGISADEPVVLYTGRIAPEKNIFLLIDSFARVRRSIPAARLLLVGDGPGRSAAEAQVRELGQEDAVTFTGFRPHDEVILACSAADVFCFPSSTDTQALSVLEAMACAVPPVVARAYGPADLVEDGISGRVVTPVADDFAAAIVSILSDPGERRRLSEGALRRSADYSTASTLQAMLEVYESVLSDQHRALSPVGD